jgi:hypothetical protein
MCSWGQMYSICVNVNSKVPTKSPKKQEGNRRHHLKKLFLWVLMHICISVNFLKKSQPEAVIFLAQRQIHKHAKDGCECLFCLWLFFCVSASRKIVFLAHRQIHITKWPFFYLCIGKILFVAQIIPPRGTFICATNKILQIQGAKKCCFAAR